MNTVALKYAFCIAMSLVVAVTAVVLTKETRLSSHMRVSERATQELERELGTYTTRGQLMGAVVTMGMAQLELKRAVLASSSAQQDAIAESLSVLKPLRLKFGLDGLYLINARGVIIAHETEGKSSTGTNVAFRPYFTQAMEGKSSVYAAVGSSTGKRGLYYAAPLRVGLDDSSPVVGVVMAKASGDPLDSMLKKYGDAAVLLSPQDVVFASSRTDWLYDMAGPVTQARVEDLRKLKQFGPRFKSGMPESLPFGPGAAEADIDGEHVLLSRESLDWGDPAGDWSVVTVWKENGINPPGMLAAVGGVSGGCTLLLLLMAFALARSRSKNREDARRFKFLGAALETSPIGVVMTDPQGVITWINPRFSDFSQYTPEEAYGNTPALISSGLTPKQTIRDLWETILDGRAWSGAFINKRKDGSHYHARNIITPVQDEEGRTLGFVSLQEDITERIRSEHAIRSAQAEMTQIFNTAAGGMRVIDKDFNVLKANDAFVALSGYSREELVGSKCYEFFCGQDCRTDQCPIVRILGGEERVETLDLYQNKDGMPIYCETAVTPHRTPDGEIVGVIADFRDMTERMKAQHLIKQSEAKYRELVESANSIILKLDMEGNITFFNEFAQKFFGFAADEVLGRSVVGSIIPETDSTGRDLRAFIADLCVNPELFPENENENMCKGGRRAWISWTNKVIRHEVSGQPTGLLCIGMDATERKKAQDELQEALEIISGSIRYASRIQRAILPAPDQIDELLPRHFTLWEPRDVVGGDIYWVRPWGGGTLLILADCTGHGVPGAFITLISSGALDRAMALTTPGDPGALIARMNRYVKVVLSQDLESGREDGSDDGLELGVCYIPPDRGRVVFSGAHFNLFVADGAEVDMIKGDRKGIGYRFAPLDAEFSNHTVAVEPGRRFYMATDGLIDQVGGERRRSYGKKRFVTLLSSLADVPLAEQGEVIFQAIERHRGREKRRDDICVVGFQI